MTRDEYIIKIVEQVRQCTDIGLLDLVSTLLDESVQESA